MKKFYKFLSILLIFTIFSSTVVFAETTEEQIKRLEQQINSLQGELGNRNDYINSLQVQIDDLKAQTPVKPAVPEKPRLVLVSPTSINIDAGKSITVTVKLKNNSSYSAYSIATTASFSDGNIIASFEGDSNFTRTLSPSATIDLKLKISANEKVEAGVYPLTLKHDFLNTTNEDQTSSSTIHVSVNKDKESTEKPNIIIQDLNVSSENIKPGDSFILSGTILNDTKQTATDVQVNIDNLKPEEIYINNSTNVFDFSKIEGGSSSKFSINLKSNEKIKKGSYPIVLKLKFRNEKGEESIKDYSYYVNIKASDEKIDTDKSQIIIESITNPGKTISVGENFNMNVTVKNNSEKIAKNIKLTAKTDETEGAIVPKSTSVLHLPLLAPGESKTLNFAFSPTSVSKSQNYVVSFNVEYEAGIKTTEDDKEETEIISFVQYQGANVNNPKADKEEEKEKEEEKISKPIIIIKEYHSSPMIAQAGREFELFMNFQNTNSVKAIKNIKVFLTVDDTTEKKGNVFSPVNSSNTFYIDSIPPKGEISRQIKMFTVPDAAPKTYTINVNFEYEDEDNNTYEGKEIVGINVKQITKLDVSEINLSNPSPSVGEPVDINFDFYNTGKVTLSNLIIKIVGEFETPSGSSIYYGNLNQSNADYFNMSIVPTTSGSHTGQIIISYEDDSGEHIEETKDFELNVMEMQENNFEEIPEGMMIDPETGMLVPFKEAKVGLQLWHKIAIGVVVGIIIIAIIVIVIIKKRKNKFDDLDEGGFN